MSQSTSIAIIPEEETDFLKILQGFLNTGWNFNDYGKITYIPLGGDAGDWENASLDSQDKILAIIKQKIEKNESIGIVVMWQDTMIGGLLVYYPYLDKKEITLLAERNRQTLKAHPAMQDIGDFTWYIEKMLPAFIDQKIHVFGVEASDYC